MAIARTDRRGRYVVRPHKGSGDYVVTDRFGNVYRGTRPLQWIDAATTSHYEERSSEERNVMTIGENVKHARFGECVVVYIAESSDTPYNIAIARRGDVEQRTIWAHPWDLVSVRGDSNAK